MRRLVATNKAGRQLRGHVLVTGYSSSSSGSGTPNVKSLMAPPLVDFAADGSSRQLEQWCQRSSFVQPMDLDITDEYDNTALIHAASLGTVRTVYHTVSEGMPLQQALREAALVQVRSLFSITVTRRWLSLCRCRVS